LCLRGNNLGKQKMTDNVQISISHEELYKWLSATLTNINEERLTDAFLYSLSSGDLNYRPYLASYVYALSILNHKQDVEVAPSGNLFCRYCGHFDNYPEDCSILDVELVRWGGVRVNDIFTVAYYLDKFLKLEPVKPNKKDFDIFNRIIDSVFGVDDSAKPRDLEKLFGKIFKSNKGQREMLINQLGIVGIFETNEHKGYHNNHIPRALRALPALSKIDWSYPVCWWRGKDKINMENFNYFFGRYPELKR